MKSFNPAVDELFTLLDTEYVGMQEARGALMTLALSIERQLAQGTEPHRIHFDPFITVGNPATGKTTMATFLAKLLYHYGLLKTPEPMLCCLHTAIHPFSGDAAEAIREMFSRAKAAGALMVIDDAEVLLTPTGALYGSSTAFFGELYASIAEEPPLFVCLTLFRHDLFDLFERNPAMERHSLIFPLKDLNAQELYQVFLNKLKAEGFTAGEDVLTPIRQLLVHLRNTHPVHLVHARYVHHIAQRMISNLTERCIRCCIDPCTEDAHRLRVEDLPAEYRR